MFYYLVGVQYCDVVGDLFDCCQIVGNEQVVQIQLLLQLLQQGEDLCLNGDVEC